jgi:hypothetical protein
MENNDWVMPQWMEPYRQHFHNTGGNTIEEVMNRKDITVFNNAPMALICTAVESQVALLHTLHKAGLLQQ